MKRVVIIGGGITGLAAAHRFVERLEAGQRDIEIILLEANSRVGGIIETKNHEGFLLERGPDSFISEKPEAIELARRIGLESNLIETNSQHRRTFIVRKGKLRPVPEGFHLLAPTRLWPFVTSDIFSWAGKARILMDLFLPKRRVNGSSDVSLAEFVRRRLGAEALARIAQPMVGGIYTADPERLSLRSTFPRFLEMEQKTRSVILGLRKQSSDSITTQSSGASVKASGPRYSLFLTFDRGMQLLVDRLQSKLSLASLQLNSVVKSLDLDPSSQWTIRLQSGTSLNADAVCIALPAYAAGSLLQQTCANLATELAAIPYESTATINLGYRREDIPHPIDGFGFVVPHIEKRTLIACTFSSIKFPGRAPEGHVLLRAFVGGALQPEMFALEEEEISERVQRELRDLLGIERKPLLVEVTKWRHSMPQYHLGHLNRVKTIEDQLSMFPTLKLAGNGYTGVGIPDCIRSGETAADELYDYLAV